MPYPIPKWLFYSENSIDKQKLTSVPTGRPDISAFIQQNPEWWLTEGDEQYHPKTIVLCDRTLPKHFPVDMQDFIQQLLDNGFEIYIWHEEDEENTLSKLNKDYLARIFNVIIPKLDKDMVRQKLAAMNKSRDQVQFLDYFDIQQLRYEATKAISEDELGYLDYPAFYKSQFEEDLCDLEMNAWDKDNLDKMKRLPIEYMDKKQYPISGILETQCIYFCEGGVVREYNESKKYYNNHFDLPEKEKIKELVVVGSEKTEYDDKLIKDIEKIVSKTLETISIVGNDNTIYLVLDTLGQKTAPISKLSIQCDKVIRSWYAGEYMENIRCLKIDSPIAPVSFKKIISHLNSIIDLRLDAKLVNSSCISSDHAAWKSIQNLDLVNCSDEFLNEILINCENLKRLTIISSKGKPFTVTQPLNSIEEIWLPYCGLHSKALLSIIMNAKNLKKIDVGEASYNITRSLDNLLADPLFEPYAHLLTKRSIKAIEEWKVQKLKSQSVVSGSENSTQQHVPKNAVVQGSGYKEGNASGDINTNPKDSPESFNLEKIFYARQGDMQPSVTKYRINVYEKLEIEKKIVPKNTAPFTLSPGSKNLVKCKQPDWEKSPGVLIEKRNTFNTHGSACYYGRYMLPPSSDWQPLPSLSSQEKLTSIFMEGVNQHDVEIKYCEKGNLYYINTHGHKDTLEVHFNVELPTAPVHFPEAIKKEIQYYQNFGVGELKLDPSKQYTGEDYLNLLKQQRVGACRHRSKAFKWQMEIKFTQYPVRIITNGCHEYVEIKSGNVWMSCDLGGYPATLDIKDKPEPAPEVSKISDVPVDASKKEEYVEELENILASQHMPNPKTMLELTDAKLTKWFTTWEEKEMTEISLLEFNQKIIQKHGSNLLVKMPVECANDYQLELQRLCKNSSRPVFYVHSPQDLVCSANWIKRNSDNSGTLIKGPGGVLHEFLAEHKDTSPVIVVNWNEFKAEDIVKFNSLIDESRLADGTSVPEKAIVVGIYDTDAPEAYDGGDFYSRFDKTYTLPVAKENISAPSWIEDAFMEKSTDEIQEAEIIDLHHSSLWKNLLLGRWIMQGEKLSFVESTFLSAIREGKQVHLKNAPWDSPSFQLFWQHALLHREITVAGRVYSLSDIVHFSKSVGYDWNDLNSAVEWKEADIQSFESIYILNSTNFGSFFNTYDFKAGKIFEEPGWLEKNKGKIISVEITRNITAAQWSELLSAAKKYDVKLQIHPKADLNLPEGMIMPKDIQKALPHSKIIVSTDVDCTVALMAKDARVIDISELQSADVLYKQNATWGDDKLSFRFEQTVSDVFQALQSGETVILKGHFSNELVDTLAGLLIQNAHVPNVIQKDKNFGELIIISDTSESLGLITYDTQKIDNKDKKNALINKARYSDENVENLESISKYGYAQLQTILKAKEINPTSASEESWLGLTHLPEIKLDVSQGEIDLSMAASELFEANRLNQVQSHLINNPYVFISGATGIGKSTFIHSTMEKTGAYAIFNEEKEIELWAKDDSDKIKILFIDEANIGSSDYSKFESLYDNPPSILINQKIVPLTENHKVIFAGNPLSYGGERHLPSLFARHGNSIVFTAMPPCYLYHAVLKPVFSGRIDENLALELSNIFLKTYEQVVALSPDNILISPRELQMMAITVMSQLPNTPDHLRAKAYDVAYKIALDVLPKELKSDFDTRFNNVFLNRPTFTTQRNKKTLGNFVLTPSRYKAYDQLNDLLKVRAYQRNAEASDAAKYGGLGGIIVEGEPGTGKSAFVTQMLHQKGFEKGNLNEKDNRDKIFYTIPVSMAQKDKEAMLLKAFAEGAIVVIDEINSSAMMEKLMNTLLMGRDLQGKRPDKPGFKLIGTENPITYAGRKARSVALQRRLMKCDFPEYPLDELIKIVHDKGIDLARATRLSTSYLECKAYAIKHNKKPIPTFRNLSKAVDRILKYEQVNKENIQLKIENRAKTRAKTIHFSDPMKLRKTLTNVLSKEGKRVRPKKSR